MRRRSLVVTFVALAATLGLAAPQLANSAPNQDPRAEREAVRAEAARVASNIDTSKASLSEIDTALQTLDENLRTQQAALARTETEVAQAETDITDAEAAIEKLTAEVDALTTEMRRRAIETYVNPVDDDVITVLDTNDFTTASNHKFYIELRAQDDADISDRLDGAGKDLAFQKEKATEAKATADAKRDEQQQRTDAVAAAKGDQETLFSSLESEINAQIARSVELSATDRELSAEIAERQAALAARLAAQKAAEQERASKAAATAAARAEAAALAEATPSPQSAPTPTPTTRPAPAPTPTPPSNQGGDGGETQPLPPVPPVGGGGTGTGGIRLCSVGGITVSCAISGSLQSLLSAARNDGVSLSGGGYRDPSGQIAARRRNCGSSYYAIYQMPSGSCRPPTAKPGTSQHEVGLAIDFSNCSSRGSACHRWLAGNASRFGFYNLPSEPWHWSTSGR